MTPRAMLPAGGVEWCFQTLELLKIRYNSKTASEQYWNETLAELEQHRAWEVVPPECPYGSEDAMLQAELGVTKDEGTAELRKWGRPRKGEGKVDNVNLKTVGGNSAKYLTRRLRRDSNPDINLDESDRRRKAELLAAVEEGRMTPHRAAIEAGYRKETIYLPLNPEAAVRVIVKHFRGGDLRTLIRGLADGAGYEIRDPAPDRR